MFQLSDQQIHTMTIYCPNARRLWRVHIMSGQPAEVLVKLPNNYLSDVVLSGHGACLMDHHATVVNSIPLDEVLVNA